MPEVRSRVHHNATSIGAILVAILKVKQRCPIVELIRDSGYSARWLHRLAQGEVFKAIADVLRFLRAVVRLVMLLNHLVNQADLLEAFLYFFPLLLALALRSMWNIKDVGHRSVQAVKKPARLATGVLVRPSVARQHRGELLLRRLLLDRRVFNKLVHYHVLMPILSRW